MRKFNSFAHGTPRGDREDRIEAREERREERREALGIDLETVRELKPLAGDPDRLEPEDFDASEDFFISESEAGNVMLNGPEGTFETRRDFSEETDTFVELAEAIRDDLGARREKFQALKALTGDPEKLELSDLDASEEHRVTSSPDGFVVLEGPRRSVETQIPFGEDTDSFVEVGAEIEAMLAELMALTGDPEKLEATDLDASEDFFITESQDGDVVINYIAATQETRIPYSEDTDTFEELAALRPWHAHLDDALDGL